MQVVATSPIQKSLKTKLDKKLDWLLRDQLTTIKKEVRIFLAFCIRAYHSNFIFLKCNQASELLNYFEILRVESNHNSAFYLKYKDTKTL